MKEKEKPVREKKLFSWRQIKKKKSHSLENEAKKKRKKEKTE